MNLVESGINAPTGSNSDAGMNRLETFTMAAMHGMLAHSSKAMPPAKILAEQSVKYAEATLAELAKSQQRSSPSQGQPSENGITK